ncbi:MAG TPA: hypothetical protein VN876_00615, partial [Gemmatimonadaceae bacterium]|nr:hypothetical protein [Gemmatimonadaceae bacterium]
MRPSARPLVFFISFSITAGATQVHGQAADPVQPGSLGLPPSTTRPGRDPNQPIDQEYTRKIREYTTEPFFLSPLVDYLPASATVPTPKAV